MLIAFASCEKQNFDETSTTIEEFVPETNILQLGSLDVDIFGADTISTQFDTIYCDQIGTTVGFTAYSMNPIKINFFSDTNPDLLELDEYDLKEVHAVEIQYNPTTMQVDTLMNRKWADDQVNATVEITESLQAYMPGLNIYTNLISGFINGTLTDDDGNSYSISASFNKITRFKL